MATEEAPKSSQEPKESTYTTPADSIVERISQLPESIHSQHNEEKINEKLEEGLERSTSNDEPIYPPMITKVAVGIGLSLSVLLVIHSSLSIPMFFNC